MQENKNYILAVLVLCFIWIAVGAWNVYIHNINEYIADFVINPIGIAIIVFFIKYPKCEKLKIFLSCYFLIYGFIFLIYGFYLIYEADSIEIDTFCFLSDAVMIYLPIKLYKIRISDILKRLKR